MEKIDFVLLWVDDSDPLWLEEKNKYSTNELNYAESKAKFRDWDNLQYWFRGVEKYTPWVNNIFFVTWGHLPKWLNKEHPNLKIINHKDFIPEKYLPTFNSNAIELNLHRIPELSEQFVLFNDDMFLIKETYPQDFFSNGKIVDQFILNMILPDPSRPTISHTNLNNTMIINKYFDKSKVVKENLFKIFNLNYGIRIFRTLLFMPLKRFSGFFNPHLPQPHFKSTFDLLWEKEYNEFDATCRNKFRDYNDISHWLLRYWNLCNGSFVPRNKRFGKYFAVTNTDKSINSYIIGQKGKTICINDSNLIQDFESVKLEIQNAFQTILPNKSQYEM